VTAEREKRRYRRREAQLPLRCRETLALPSPFRGVQMKDVSLGGLRFQDEGFIPPDTSLIFEFSLPRGGKPVRAISRVAWSRKLPSGDRYEFGGQFVEMLTSEKKFLEEYLLR
jgi:hypothetical protein